MKKLLLIFLVIAIVSVVSLNVFAEGSDSRSQSSDDFSITAEIVNQISVTAEDVDFGVINSNESHTETVNFTTKTDDSSADYEVSLDENVELSNEAGDSIMAVLETSETAQTDEDGEDSFGVDVTLDIGSGVSGGSYNGVAQVTVEYSD